MILNKVHLGDTFELINLVPDNSVDFIIGYCECVTPFEYKVVSSEEINSSGRFYPKGTSFYPKELKII